MKIEINRGPDGFMVHIDRPPMKEARFRALCALTAAAVYAGIAIAAAALCGLLGLIAVGFVTVLLVAVEYA